MTDQSNPLSYAIREAGRSDLSAISRVHLNAYSSAHFTSLLPAEVLESYYGLFLGGGSQIKVCEAVEAGGLASEICGFSVFGRAIPERLALFKKDFRKEIWATSLAHPVKAAKKALSLAPAKLQRETPRNPCAFLLLSIAADRKGAGIGELLLRDLLATAAAAGETRVGLYVNAPNIGAINKYFTVGFRIVEHFHGQYYMERTVFT